jgi:integrase
MTNNIGHNSINKTLEDFIITGTGRIKITDQIVRDYLKPTIQDGVLKDKIIYDSEVIGLRCRVRIGGSKVWFFEFTPTKSKSSKRYTFGSFPEVRTAEARNLCKRIKHAIETGIDPKATIVENTNARTLEALADEWIASVLNVSKRYGLATKRHTKARLTTWLYLKPAIKRMGSNAETIDHIHKHFSVLNIKKINMKLITKQTLEAYHNAISLRSPSQANRVIDDIQQIFNYALEKGDISKNVCKFSKSERNTIDKRMDTIRPFTKQQLKIIKSCALRLSFKFAKSLKVSALILLMLAFTGRRKMEICMLRWDQVSPNLKEITFKSTDTKNKTAFTISLLPMATAILRRMKKFRISQISARRNYVFPSTKESKKNYLNDPRSTWNLIIKMAQEKDATINYKCIHMLRHTFACLLLEATKDIKLVAKIMNWKSLKVAEIYADYIGKEHTEKGIEKLEEFLQVA